MHKHRFVLAVVACFVVLSMVLGQGTLVLAGTTGGLTGTVTDPTTKQPIAGASVTAASPSQVAKTTTDASGHFAFLSLAPDTYTISVEKVSYEPTSDSGVTIVADNTQSVSITTQHQLRTIGRTTARGGSSLVKSGVTSDVYSITPAQQAAAAPLGGGNNLNSAYSAIQSAPGVFVPISDSGGWGQSINLRGGDYTQTGNEVDGVPINRAFDQYAGSPLSSIGNAEVQVYTGNQPVDAQANGLAGFVNQVIRTGTFPGFGNVNFGVGAPGYYHKFSAEYGGATSNRNFTYYLGFLGYNQQNRYVDQFNGAGYTPIYGSTINYVAAGCGTAHPTVGCYANGPNASLLGGLPLGPNGYVTAPLYFSSVPSIADREGVVNLHIAVPHPHDGLKDDIQLLYNTGETYNTPNSAFGDFNGSLGDVINGTVNNGAIQNFSSVPADAKNGCPTAGGVEVACAPATTPTYFNQTLYTGPLYSKLRTANLSQIKNVNFAGSNSGIQQLGGAVPFNQRDSETTGFAIGKIQYQRNFSSNAYARAYAYSNYSDRIDNGIVGAVQNYVGAFPTDYLISAHTSGVGLVVADQINPQNLLTLAGGYSYTNSSRYNNTFSGNQSTTAYLVSSANPTGGCYDAGGAITGCTGALAKVNNAPARYVPGGGALTPSKGSPVLGTEGGLSCGGAPCEYFSIGNGAVGGLNLVRPAFTNASLSDIIKPTDKLTVQASLRYEDFTYNLLDENNPGNQLLVNSYNAGHCVQGTTVKTIAVGTPCSAGFANAALSAAGPVREDYAHIFSPRLGLTYALDPNTVLRASYGRFTQPAETSAVDATNITPAVPSTPFFTNFGFASYARSVSPEISYNTDFSIEHAIPKADIQFSVSPFYRQTTDEFISILVDPKTNFIANINGLNRKTEGAEFAFTKGNFARDGLAFQLAYTFTYATSKYKVFPNGGSFVAGANAGIQQYNGYTKFCATNPKSKLCGATSSGAAASPCYNTDGTAAPACAAGSIANPYWNSQPFGTLDPNASYFPYNQGLQVGFAGNATSYIVPHVANLIVQYKKGPWTISPSVQFQGGSRYGSPLVAQGIAPDTCTGVLAGASLAGDPRYANGPGAGSPYDASTCANVIPIPNPQTKHFDGVGEYVQPNLLATNLSINYDFNKKVGLNVIAANIFNRCFGGSNVPWGTGNLGCAYSQAGTYVANSYNPGDAIQPYAAQSYTPVLGGALQSVSAGSPLPFELFVNLNVHI